MKVIILETQLLAGEVLLQGETCDISEGQALTWAGCGVAELAEKPAAPAKKGKEGDG